MMALYDWHYLFDSMLNVELIFFYKFITVIVIIAIIIIHVIFKLF